MGENPLLGTKRNYPQPTEGRAMTEDFYDRLGVARDADQEDIQRAYRGLASRYHPDVSNDPDAEERFKRIKHAYDVLSDEQTRRKYDRLGHEAFTHDNGTGTSRDPGSGRQHTRPGGINQGAGASGFAGGFNSLFDQIFHGFHAGPYQRTTSTSAGSETPRPTPGDDLKTTLDIDLRDAYHGTQQDLTVTRADPCPSCAGRGYATTTDPASCPKCNGRGHIIHIKDTSVSKTKHREPCNHCAGTGEIPGELCPECNGDGRIKGDTTIAVDIPGGVQTGQTIRLKDKGNVGEHGGPRGDIILGLHVADHPEFTRDDADLYTNRAVSFPQAALGSTVEIPTFDESVALSIPAGTQSGETLRLKGEGMPVYREPDSGDLYVHIQVVTPDNLTAEQRAALRAFESATPE